MPLRGWPHSLGDAVGELKVKTFIRILNIQTMLHPVSSVLEPKTKGPDAHCTVEAFATGNAYQFSMTINIVGSLINAVLISQHFRSAALCITFSMSNSACQPPRSCEFPSGHRRGGLVWVCMQACKCSG
jgi:hypothetical protein